MPAQFFKFGDPPPTFGGDAERLVAERLRDELPDGYVLLGNPSFPTHGSYFYEYDLVLISPFLCEVIEVKAIAGGVTVEEDQLVASNGKEFKQVFSTLENKTRVLREKLAGDLRTFAIESLRTEW